MPMESRKARRRLGLSLGAGILAIVSSACRWDQATLEVELTTERLEPAEMAEWPIPALESGRPEIVVRQVFTARGPCRELSAELMPRYPGEFLLRVVAEDRSPCPYETPHLGYMAVLRGMSPGSHQLRVVHVGADGRPLAEAVFEHPVVVTGRPAR